MGESPESQTAGEVRQLLGPVRQVGYVVADVEAGAHDWIRRFGVGPWRVRHGIVFDECTYRGHRIDVEVSIASAYSNGVEIELIAQAGESPSMYSDFLRTQGPGAQHVCFYPADYDAARSHLIDAGLAVLLEGVIRGTDFAYLDDGVGQVIEIADVSADGLAARAERAEAAAAWNGVDSGFVLRPTDGAVVVEAAGRFLD